MRRLPWLLAILLLPFFLFQAPAAQAQDYYENPAAGYGGEGQLDVSVFYEALAPYGDWHYVPQYGYVWIPNVDHRTWRPYADGGHWVWSDYGWMWASDYPWGWAAFHYGRWVWLDNAVWVWVPDVVWGPAWVAWRYTDDYVGWSPLPPGAYWYPDYGLDVTVSVPEPYWVFVPGPYILDVYIWRHFVPRGHIRHIYAASHRSTVYRVHAGYPVCVGIDIYRVNRWVGYPVRSVTVTVSTTMGVTSIHGNAVYIYRPTYNANYRYRATPPPATRRAPTSLSKMYTPPPPARAGVSPSQVYRSAQPRPTSSSQQRSTASPQPTQSGRQRAVDTYQPVPRSPEVQQERREVQSERRDVQGERRELQEDRSQLRHDVRTQPENRTQVQQDVREVQQGRGEVRSERRDVVEERPDVRTERRETYTPSSSQRSSTSSPSSSSSSRERSSTSSPSSSSSSRERSSASSPSSSSSSRERSSSSSSGSSSSSSRSSSSSSGSSRSESRGRR